MPFNARHNYNVRNDYSTASGSGSVGIAGGSSNTVNGILRKVNGSNANASSVSNSTIAAEVRHVDLLVFGYACKVFRDDAKAREIDQGKHLIPWMGDNNLKIDRYDVRGALYDLTPYEPPPGGYGNRLDYLTAEEQRAEQLCEEERYLFLYNNEEDLITKQEEELKRLQQETNGSSYAQVEFSYDQTQQIGPNREEFLNSPTCEEAEQAFQLPYNFKVPAEMQLPETMKQHAIIEKTARFIASQGVQMEILLKAKQSNNVQFEFLTQSSTLNPYYKYMINSIKDGSYPQQKETKEKIKSETDNDNTLSLSEQIVEKPVVTVPTIKYKPSADCAYTQLISKIKGVPLSELHDENSRNSLTSQQESANNSPSLTPVLLQYNNATFVTEPDDNSNSNTLNTQTNATGGECLNESQPKVEILKNSSALALAQNYSSGSETEEEPEVETKEKTPPKLEFPLPPESLQNIIDKTAVYVIKNGRQFEETLRSKSVDRFTFLLPDNEYYPYYMYKITGDPNAASKEQKKRKAKEVAQALLSKKGLNVDKSTTNPVSFSIKTKEEGCTNVPLPQPALPQEHSDDEDKPKTPTSATATTGNQRHVPEHVQKAIQLVESQLMARNAQLAATLALRQTPVTSNMPLNNPLKTLTNRYETDKMPTKLINSTNAPQTTNSSKAEAERNALYEQQQQQRHKELKKAEEKVKDKLAQIAREKLGGLISKEKQLQLERKRKVMAFLNQIKGVSPTDNTNDECEPEKKCKTNDEDDGNNSDDTDVSVHSIPITSYGPNSEDELLEEKLVANKIIAPTQLSPPHILAKTKDIKQQQQQKTATVNVSDDDEVELISELKPREIFIKHRSRSRSRDNRSVTISNAQTRRHYRKHDKRTPSTDSLLSSNNEDEGEQYEDDRVERRRSHRSKSKSSHKVKKSKTKKSSKSKKKSKKRSRSKTRTRSRSRSRSHHRHHQHEHHRQHQRRRSRSRSYSHDYYALETASTERERERAERKRSSHTPLRSSYQSSSTGHSHKEKKHRYD